MVYKTDKGLKTSHELFTLIKSLTPEEKGYFKKMANRDGRAEKNGFKYALLFDAIEQTENADTYLSKEFEQSLIQQKIVKNYSDEKSHLQEMILKALRAFNSKRQVDMKLSDALKDIFILKERKLPILHLKAIIKAKEIATKYERYLRLIEVIHEEIYYYVSNLPAEKIEEKYNNLQADLRTTMEVHHQCVSLKSIKTFLYKQVMSGDIIQDIDQIIAEVESFRGKVASNPLFSFHLSFNFYSCNFLILYYQKRFEESMEYSTMLIQLYHEFPVFKKEHETIFQANICNHIEMMIQANKFEEAKKMMQNFKQDYQVNPSEKTKCNFIHSKLFIFINSGLHFELPEIDKEFWQLVKGRESSFNLRYLINMYTNFSIANFALGDYKRMDFYNGLLLATTAQEKNKAYYKARVTELIIHFEMMNYEILDDMVRNIKREKDYKQFLKIVEPPFFTLLKRAVKSPQNIHSLKKNYKGKFCGDDLIQLWLDKH